MSLSATDSTALLDPTSREALDWLVRRMDVRSWTAADDEKLLAWRRSKPEHEREFTRHEFIAKLISQPQSHRTLQGSDADETNVVAKTRQLLQERPTSAEAHEKLLCKLEAVLDLSWTDRSALALRLQALAFIKRGNLRGGTAVHRDVAGALKDYDAAERLLLELLADPPPSWRDDLADLCNHRGLTLLSVGGKTSAKEAVISFERSIQIRQPLLTDGNGWDRYKLAAAWMNKGDALRQAGEAAGLGEAIAAYREALALMREIPLETQPLFRRRFVVACINLSSLHLERNDVNDPAAVIECCAYALAAMEFPEEKSPEDRILLASIWASRGAALSRARELAKVSAIQQACQKALSACGDLEFENFHAAEAGLKARHALCVGLGFAISSRIEATQRETFVNEATQAVHAGLRLGRRWETKGFDQLSALTEGIFLFGANLMEIYQPHALGHFLLMQLGKDESTNSCWRPDLRKVGLAKLSTTIDTLLQARLKSSNNAVVTDYYLDSLKELRRAESALRELDSIREERA